MTYEEWLMHFNENHDPRNGQFTSTEDAKAIVKNTRKAMKKGVLSKKSKKYVKDIKKRINDEELERLIVDSRNLFDEFQKARMDWKLGLISEKKMTSKYNAYQENMDAKFKRSDEIAKSICDSIGIHDPLLESKLSLILR